MDAVNEKYILSAIKVIRKQQQRPDKSSICAYLERKHGLSISAVMRTIDRMLDSAAIYCKPRNGKDSYYVFDPLALGEIEDDVDSGTEYTQMLRPCDIDTSETDNESNPLQSVSPELHTSKQHACESLDTTLGFLDVMGKLADTVNELNKQLCTERERDEKLTSKLNLNTEEILKLHHKIQVLEAKSRNKSKEMALMENKENDDIVTAQTKLTFSSQWNSYVKAKSQQYEQYLISKKFEELKSATPKGTNTREEKIYKNNTEWMPKAEKKSENTINRNQESGIIQKQIKSINLDAIKSDSKEKQQPPSKNADDASDVHLWRKGTTLIAGDSILYGIDEKKICQNGSVKVRAFPGATIEDLKDYYIKPLLRKQPSKVILHVGTNNASVKNASPDQILNALLDFKKDIEDQIPGCIVVLSMPTKRFDNEKLGKIIESLNDKISNLGIVTVNNNNISRSDIGRKGLHLNARGTNKLMHRFISKLNRL